MRRRLPRGAGEGKVSTDQAIQEAGVGEVAADAQRRSVVVGADGSPAGSAALVWAAKEARRTGDRVRVIHIREQPAVRFVIGNRQYAGVSDGVESMVRRDVAWLRTESDSSADALDITVEAIDGDPKQVLVELSQQVDLLILGTEGSGRRRGLLLGDVVSHCLRHAACPVVVTPPSERLASRSSG